jgi:hypothetical protein
MSEGSTCPLFARAEARPHLSTVPLCSIQFSVTNDALCERDLLFPVVVASAIATRRTVVAALRRRSRLSHITRDPAPGGKPG